MIKLCRQRVCRLESRYMYSDFLYCVGFIHIQTSGYCCITCRWWAGKGGGVGVGENEWGGGGGRWGLGK